MILLDHQNNYVEHLKILMRQFAISLNVLHNYFDSPNIIIFRYVSS